LTLELGHTPAHGEADFLVGEGNQLAYSRIMAFPDWPDPITLLIGPAKSGKSHLARIFADRSDARFAGVADLDTLATEGGTKPVVIEDVDRLDYGEAGLFHLLNQSMREQRPILMTAREEIAHWQLVTDDVRSRARRATAYTLELTDDIQLSQMFVKLFEDRQLKVDPRIVSYLVARMERSAEEAVLLADLMDRLALARATAVTRNIAAEALARRRLARGETDNTEQHLDTEDDE
jgi:chromosomal replication initiation ATPase DnaA